jgi:hypothetical protein
MKTMNLGPIASIIVGKYREVLVLRYSNNDIRGRPCTRGLTRRTFEKIRNLT